MAHSFLPSLLLSLWKLHSFPNSFQQFSMQGLHCHLFQKAFTVLFPAHITLAFSQVYDLTLSQTVASDPMHSLHSAPTIFTEHWCLTTQELISGLGIFGLTILSSCCLTWMCFLSSHETKDFSGALSQQCYSKWMHWCSLRTCLGSFINTNELSPFLLIRKFPVIPLHTAVWEALP